MPRKCPAVPSSISKVKLNRCICLRPKSMWLSKTVDQCNQVSWLVEWAKSRHGNMDRWMDDFYQCMDMKIKRLPGEHAWVVMKPINIHECIMCVPHGMLFMRSSRFLIAAWRKILAFEPWDRPGAFHNLPISINVANDGDNFMNFTSRGADIPTYFHLSIFLLFSIYLFLILYTHCKIFISKLCIIIRISIHFHPFLNQWLVNSAPFSSRWFNGMMAVIATSRLRRSSVPQLVGLLRDFFLVRVHTICMTYIIIYIYINIIYIYINIIYIYINITYIYIYYILRNIIQ